MINNNFEATIHFLREKGMIQDNSTEMVIRGPFGEVSLNELLIEFARTRLIYCIYNNQNKS